MKNLMIIVVCISLQACAMLGTLDRPQSYFNSETDENEESILNSTEEGLQDAEINALLYQKVELPKKIRIAILKLSKDDYWRFYSYDFTQLNDSIARNLIDKLKASDRVYDASFLPSMLVPEKHTLSVLREAAAHFQADALLVYRSSCNSYQKHRFISPDETNSYCSVEAVLLDVSKGIVVKSVVTTQGFIAKNNSKDSDFKETAKKSELEVLSKAFGEIAKEIVDYLNNVAVSVKESSASTSPHKRVRIGRLIKVIEP